MGNFTYIPQIIPSESAKNFWKFSQKIFFKFVVDIHSKMATLNPLWTVQITKILFENRRFLKITHEFITSITGTKLSFCLASINFKFNFPRKSDSVISTRIQKITSYSVIRTNRRYFTHSLVDFFFPSLIGERVVHKRYRRLFCPTACFFARARYFYSFRRRRRRRRQALPISFSFIFRARSRISQYALECGKSLFFSSPRGGWRMKRSEDRGTIRGKHDCN